MKTFRKKYIYNPDNPIYQSDCVRTFNCMNTETKDKRLIIIEHLKDFPFVEPALGTLQPIEIPTSSEPVSVYPIVRCVSQIGKTSEPQAMYVLGCILESKIKKPLYMTISTQGICCSEVEGILPSRSPDIFQLAIDLLDLPSNLQETEEAVVSKEGYAIVRALKNGENPLPAIQNYGWREIKKQKDHIEDQDFVTFKGRRNQEGPFGGEYGLAWSNEHGLCKMRYINLTKDGYEEEWYNQYQQILAYIQKSQANQKNPVFMKIYKFQKTMDGIKIFSQIGNEGCLSDYINKKHQLNQSLTEKNCVEMVDAFAESMAKLSQDKDPKLEGLGTLHLSSLVVHNNRICISDPLFVTDKVEKKLRELRSSMDYFAPQFKENVLTFDNLNKFSRQKMDVWSFGFILHKMLMREVPVFDQEKKPILSKSRLSSGMYSFLSQCFGLSPNERPSWSTIKMKEITSKMVVVEDVIEERNNSQRFREQIRLGSRSERRQKLSPRKRSRVVEELNEEHREQISIVDRSKDDDEQRIKLKQQQEEVEVPYISPIPTEISSRLKKIKLAVKTIIVMALYIFLFFRMFLGNSISLLSARRTYSTVALKLVDYNSNLLSTVSVITNDPLFFLKNDISFTEVQEKYQCINDRFDPIYNPNYSLLSYINSNNFLIMALVGWVAALVICFVKALSIWKGGISNRPMKKQGKFWATYVFHELTLAALLFAHFYIFEFFYFAGSSPCLSISNFSGLQPFFDSSLLLFLQNTNAYFQQIFSTLGILAILLTISTCFYAWGPKLDQKYFISVPSIILRFIPFILLLLICRIGIFLLFSPTAINDQAKLIPALMANSFMGFIGILPEIFILLTLTLEAIIELFMLWCERKTAQSDQLSRLFNTKDKKVEVNNDESKGKDMSVIDHSKQRLDENDIEQL